MYSYLRLRRTYRLKMLALIFFAVMIAVFSFFVYPRDITFDTEHMVLTNFSISNLPNKTHPFNSSIIPEVTGELEFDMLIENSNFVGIDLLDYNLKILYGELTLGKLERMSPFMVVPGVNRLAQVVQLSSKYLDNNTANVLYLESVLKQVGGGSFNWRVEGNVSVAIFDIPYSTSVSFGIPIVPLNPNGSTYGGGLCDADIRVRDLLLTGPFTPSPPTPAPPPETKRR
jgi:hypothetical protein